MTKQEIIELEKRAEKNDSMSMYSLGVAYFQGDGVEQNMQKSLKYFIDSVWNGNASAGYQVAQFKRGNYGIEPDLLESFFYCLHAAKSGNINAYVLLGDYYMHVANLQNSGIPYNPYTANLWYQKAATAGNVDGMFRFSVNLHDGKGCAINLDDSLYWSECAAENGHVGAMYNTAAIYDGEQYPTFFDANKAGYWWNEAACRGNQEAKRYLEKHYRFSSFSNKWKKVNY